MIYILKVVKNWSTMFNCKNYWLLAIQMADEDRIRKHSEKLFKKVKVGINTFIGIIWLHWYFRIKY